MARRRRHTSRRSRLRSLRQRSRSRHLRFESLENRRLLAVFTVTNLEDTGAGSLRDAVAMANSTDGADTVEFSAGLSGGVISLGLGEIEITESLTIDARPLAANVTIDAGGASRIFNFTATVGDFTLGGLTLTGGRATGSNVDLNDSTFSGGAIRSLTSGNLTIDQSTVDGNGTTGYLAHGGGIWTSGPLTITHSTVTGNSTTGNGARGGGVYTRGAITLRQSTVGENSTAGIQAFGGGIRAIGSVMLTESTVSENSTMGDGSGGGGIFANGALTLTDSTVSGNTTEGTQSYGGGINNYGDVTLTRSTLSGNRTGTPNAHGGGIFVRGAVTLNQSTVTDNHATASMGGGVFQVNTASNHVFTISGSIVAGNTAGGGGADLVKDLDSALPVTFSLIGTGINPTLSINNVVTDQPQLGPLANNGGSTQTHAPLSGSPAVDAGSSSIVFNPAEFDQRGAPFVRVFDGDGIDGARVDIGAYEVQSIVLQVDTTADEDDGDHSDGDLSLREAIGLANANLSPDTITFATELSGQTILLGGTELVVTEAVTIDARPLAANVTIDANEASRAFNITATTGDFTLGGLALTGGRTTGDNVKFDDNTFSGGAIRSLTSGKLTIDQSTIDGNSTTGTYGRGGGIWASGSVTLIQSTVRDNSTAGSQARGGGINSNHNVSLTQSTVTNNSTTGNDAQGGGILSGGTVTLIRSTVRGNSTIGNSAHGGGVFTWGGVALTHSTVSENSTTGAGAHGGGIAAGSSVSLTQSAVSGNSTTGASAHGGGINASGSVTLTQSAVSGNGTAGPRATGGGIAAGSSVSLTQSTVSRNSTVGSSSDGGGIISSHAVTLTESTIIGNSTAGDGALGGGIRARSVTFTQSTVSGNSTAGVSAPGGGIWTSGSVTLNRSTVTDNHAMAAPGGGVYQYNSGSDLPFEISGSIVADNTAGGGGDDLFKDPQSQLTANYSLIGTGITPSAGGNNVVTDDPKLGPLADNGGPTRTHALLPGSPALDAGDPAAVAGMDGVPEFDQRGMPYSRVANGDVPASAVIDIGAYEAQAIPEWLAGDYNRNGIIDAADYTMWRDALGATDVAPLTGADGDGDGEVTNSDYRVWKSSFGYEFASPAAGSGPVATALAEPVAHDGANEPASQPHQHTAERADRIALGALIYYHAPASRRGEFGAQRHASSTILPRAQPALSPRAVELLLAVAERAMPDDAWGVRFALLNGDTDDRAANEASASAFDLALAALDRTI